MSLTNLILGTWRINRVEVIDNNGRSYVFDPRQWPGYKIEVKTDLQDGGRTLKVFIDVRDQSHC